MRRTFFILVLAMLIGVPVSNAQYRQNDELHAGHQAYNSDERKSKDRAAQTHVGESLVTVEWSAPTLRERQLFGLLIPPGGKVWRTGANEATVIHFDDDVVIEGETLEAGNYALFCIGSEDEFTFIFNGVSQQWGAFEHDSAQDKLRVTVETGVAEHQEELLFSFLETSDTSTVVRLSWGTATAAFNVALSSDD